MSRKRIFTGILVVAVLSFVVLQVFANSRWPRTNPPIAKAVAWNSEDTADLVRRACYDCHSNETVWPWYSQVVPGAILIGRHVLQGRHELNFSEADRSELKSDKLIETIQEGEMPPQSYLLLHPDAKFSDDEKARLISGIRATFGGGQDSSEEHEQDDD